MKQLIFILLFIPTFLFGQTWEKTYEKGTGYSVDQTTDGGFIVIGSGINNGRCIYMIKTNITGDTLWRKYHCINSQELFCFGHQTSDGGYVITGSTVPADSFDNDVFLLKTDNNGDTLWSRKYGGDDDEIGLAVQQTEDEGYIITGWTESFSTNHKVYLIKTDSNGEIMWEKTYGDNNQNSGHAVHQVDDGGYFITGFTFIPGSGFSWVNLIKTDSIGDIIWTSTYDDYDEDFAHSGQQTSDGGFIVAGATENDINKLDVLLIKTFTNGDIEWVKTYGQSDYTETGRCVRQTFDGGYIIAGSKQTYDNSSDVYLVKTDYLGNELWSRTFGGLQSDGGYSVQQTADEGYIVTGVYQDNSDVRYVYLIKTDENGIITFTNEIPILNPNRKLIKTVDMSGRELTKAIKNQPYIEIYDDGTTEKKMNIR